MEPLLNIGGAVPLSYATEKPGRMPLCICSAVRPAFGTGHDT